MRDHCFTYRLQTETFPKEAPKALYDCRPNSSLRTISVSHSLFQNVRVSVFSASVLVGRSIDKKN